jgi:hypothetical protein
MAATSRYGLRARSLSRGESAPRDDATVEALLFVGLKPKVLTKPERQAFGGQMTDYIAIRWGQRPARRRGCSGARGAARVSSGSRARSEAARCAGARGAAASRRRMGPACVPAAAAARARKRVGASCWARPRLPPLGTSLWRPGSKTAPRR